MQALHPCNRGYHAPNPVTSRQTGGLPLAQLKGLPLAKRAEKSKVKSKNAGDKIWRESPITAQLPLHFTTWFPDYAEGAPKG
jgi:hypothetical protein